MRFAASLAVLLLLALAAGCSRKSRSEVAWEWSFRSQGFAVGTSTIIGMPDEEELAYFAEYGFHPVLPAELDEREEAVLIEQLDPDPGLFEHPWTGTPAADEEGWPYRYVFDSPTTTAGYVMHRGEDGTWRLAGFLRDLEREGDKLTCTGPVGVVGKSLPTGMRFEFRQPRRGPVIARFTCDAFDSRHVTWVFHRRKAAAPPEVPEP